MSFDEQPDAPLHGECAAEIAALRQQLLVAQVEVKRLRVAVYNNDAAALAAPSDTSAIDALQRDAERYRWLRKDAYTEQLEFDSWYWGIELNAEKNEDGTPEQFDAAIDAAIGASHG